MNSEQSRRKFIITSSKILSIIVGVVVFGKQTSWAKTEESTIMEKVKSPKIYQNKILVAYDSQFASTVEVARFIGENLSSENEKVDVKEISEVDDLSAYKQVIIGSPIQYDKWMKDAENFIIENETELSTKSVSFFLVCLVLSKKTEKAKIKANGYAKEIKNVVPKINISSFGMFAGVLDYSKMSIGQRILAKVLFSIIGIKKGDYRNWDTIKKWCLELKD